MERFNYPNLAAVLAEDAEMFRLLEAETYGYKADQQERMEEMEAEVKAARQNVQ